MDFSGTPRENLLRAAGILEGGFDEIFAGYMGELRAMHSPLLEDAEIGEQLKTQARMALKDAAAILRGEYRRAGLPDDGLSEAVAASRARRSVHPSESLRAVTALLRAALSVVADELPTSPTSRKEVAAVAVALHEGIMARVTRAAIAYGDYLLGEVHRAHADERRRIGRELHDRVAHSIMVVFRNLELYEMYAEQGQPAKARQKLESAKRAAQETFETARSLSFELRSPPTDKGLKAAIADLLATSVRQGTCPVVAVRGDERLVPAHVRDELFLILREAVLNAVSHSEARSLSVEIAVGRDRVEALVEDDGRGFESGESDRPAGTGLASMRERAALLGGTFRVASRAGGGTSLSVSVPLARGRT